MEGFRTITGRW